MSDDQRSVRASHLGAYDRPGELEITVEGEVDRAAMREDFVAELERRGLKLNPLNPRIVIDEATEFLGSRTTARAEVLEA